MICRMANQRTHFRLEYPQAERPRLKLPKEEFEIVDLSEKGLKFDCGPRFKPAAGTVIKGTVVFKDGKTCDIVGSVLRLIADKNHCVLTLSKGIPLAKMMEEQRLMIQKFKGR